MRFEDFWYVISESTELQENQVIHRQVLDEWIAIFRGPDKKPVALRDVCLHRGAQLSLGKVRQGVLECPYHGWKYDSAGNVVQVPSDGTGCPRIGKKKSDCFLTVEVEGYIYVCLSNSPCQSAPFSIPLYKTNGYHSIRLQHLFNNNVVNCVENFVDIPHTVSVHAGIFRVAKNQEIKSTVVRKNGSVLVNYLNEDTNFGWFKKFLNPKKHKIFHTDSFHMPNVTFVEYRFGPKRHFMITSQSVPVSNDTTLVYTDLTYNYGFFSKWLAPIIKWQAKKIIKQDVDILANQLKVIKKYNPKFHNSPADIIHVLIESVIESIEKGEDPLKLPEKSHDITFWV